MQSVEHSCMFFTSQSHEYRRTKVISRLLGSLMWQLQSTHANASRFVFQPRSNKAEKFDYVSSCSSPLLTLRIQNRGSVVSSVRDAAEHGKCCLFVVPGHGVCEKDGRPGVRGIQQCHVSALSDKFEAFEVNVSSERRYSVGQIACRLLCCIIDVSILISLRLCLRFQSEKETGNRNFAIGYYMKEKKVS